MPRLLTVADFAVFPTNLPSGDVCYELDDGKLVVTSPPGDVHGALHAHIIAVLLTDAEERGLGEGFGRVGIVLRRNPDRVVCTDAAFILAQSLPRRETEEGFLGTIPELVVEILDKYESPSTVADKVTEYLVAGVIVVWVIDSKNQAVVAYRADQPAQVFRLDDDLTCPDLLPNFSIPLASLFDDQ